MSSETNYCQIMKLKCFSSENLRLELSTFGLHQSEL